MNAIFLFHQAVKISPGYTTFDLVILASTFTSKLGRLQHEDKSHELLHTQNKCGHLFRGYILLSLNGHCV